MGIELMSKDDKKIIIKIYIMYTEQSLFNKQRRKN